MAISDEQKAKRREAHKEYMRRRRATDPSFLKMNAEYATQKYHDDPQHRQATLTRNRDSYKSKMKSDPDYRQRENARKQSVKRKARNEKRFNEQYEYELKREEEASRKFIQL